ncbi:MAG TPA: hypothetical protein PLS69_06420 [Terricaulis sp.]|nr:hypothetical protein [Terricaulis sp.]HRP11389.1 hypothetical protein [Terricaulis sp.]
MHFLLGALLALMLMAAPARAESGEEAAIRALIDQWYAQQRAGESGRIYALLAPGAIDASPGYRHLDTGAANRAPRVYTSLAATALQFDHEISRLDIDTRFARVGVWERGFNYAWAAERTYESAGYATFVLEKQQDGRWLVLAHRTGTIGIPPNRRTDPLPDMRPLWEARQAAAQN